jgi:hypothetical protein
MQDTTYILCQFLGHGPIAREEDVSSGIQDVSDGNHAVHIQWQLKITSIAFCEFQFHGEYLQGSSIHYRNLPRCRRPPALGVAPPSPRRMLRRRWPSV